MSTVTFPVHNVILVNPSTCSSIQKEKKTLKDAVISRFKNDKRNPIIEAVSDNNKEIYEFEVHGLFKAIHDAYDKHVGLEITPDHIKLLILQGFSMHINENSEKFRTLFVDHTDKKVIKVQRDDFVKGRDTNPWPEVFGQFTDKIKNDIKDPTLVNLAQVPFETSTDTTIASFNIALMETVQKYYSYEFYTMCGIPFITIKGSVQDWKSIYELVMYIKQFDLDWWTDKIGPIIDEFIKVASHNNTLNTTFWKNILKINNESGGPYYDGWITYFFPYLVHKTGMSRNKFTKTIFNFPSGLSSVPVKWTYFDKVFDMNFTSGFFGYSCTSDRIIPEISWAITNETHEMVPEEQVVKISDDVMAVYKFGKYYNPAWTHYGKPGTVFCDNCNKSDLTVCVGYDNTDVCMQCMHNLGKMK